MAEEKTNERRKTILFVCTGNTCRSSMAEALAKDFLERRQAENTEDRTLPEIKVLSAGTGALENEPASTQAQLVMSERGLDLSGHQARFLTTKMLQEADLILTMTKRHQEYIEEIMPQVQGKVYLLKEYAQGESALQALQEKAAALYEQIEKKKRSFYQAHRQEIEALENRKEALLRQLKEVENEFNAWEKQLAEIAAGEISELKKVEELLSNQDIFDPFGQPAEAYRQCANELMEYIPKALDRFLQEKSSPKSK